MKIYSFYGKEHPLSNMYIFTMEYQDKVRDISVEHLFQIWKAKMFQDDAIFNLIVNEPDPKKAKSLGKKVVPFDAGKWDKVKETYMGMCLETKWKHCVEFRGELMNAYDSCDYIAEASPRDTYWGTGYGKERTKAGESRGKNRLGILLWELADKNK